MPTDQALVKKALDRATGATIHGISSWILKYRLAAKLGDAAGKAAAEQVLRNVLRSSESIPPRPEVPE